MKERVFLPAELVGSRILTIRGHRVIVDADLAELYEVETRVLNQAVRRNAERFPPDFILKLSREEIDVISEMPGSIRRKRLKFSKNAYAFTEYGVAMLSSVLNSPRAIAANIEIMRAFSRLRGILAEHRELLTRLDVLEKRYDAQFKDVFAAIRQLMEPPAKPPRRIGF